MPYETDAYADNLLVLDMGDKEVLGAARQRETELRASGQSTHDVEGGSQVESVGLSCNGTAKTVAVSARRGWRLFFAH